MGWNVPACVGGMVLFFYIVGKEVQQPLLFLLLAAAANAIEATLGGHSCGSGYYRTE